MNDQPTPNPTIKPRFPAAVGWVLAALLVIGAWVGAYAMRGGGEKAVLAGWQDGLAAGQQVAQESDKPMVVLFTAAWCAPCQQLKHDVLTQPGVNDSLQAGFVPVQVDVTDQSSSNPNVRTAMRYGVRGIPTVIAMTPEGEPIDTYSGGPSVDAFESWLAGVQK